MILGGVRQVKRALARTALCFPPVAVQAAKGALVCFQSFSRLWVAVISRHPSGRLTSSSLEAVDPPVELRLREHRLDHPLAFR